MENRSDTYDRFSRTLLLIGKEKLQKLFASRVFIAGLGGVGSYAFEAIVRAGIGEVYIVDYDNVEISNCNRQLLALESTLTQPKVDIAERRAKDINPYVIINKKQIQITPHNIHEVMPHTIDFAIDAIDDVVAKTALIQYCYQKNIPFISCMGAARAFNPESLRISDIGKTQYCPLARTMRKRLKEKGIVKGVMCVYFHEERSIVHSDSTSSATPGSLSYMPGIMGLAAAGYAIQHLTGKE